jgi:Tol biopolymer transport system component
MLWPDHFSRDGKNLLFTLPQHGDLQCAVLDLSAGTVRQLTPSDRSIGFPSWSPDEKLIAAEMRDGPYSDVVVVDPNSGAIQRITRDRTQVWPNGWFPDGDRIVTAKIGDDGTWNVWSVSRTTGAEKKITGYKGLNSYVRYPVVSPRGNQIVYEYSETIGNIWMLDLK